MKQIKKEKSHAFRKDVFLLGIKEGKKIWLEEATFNCSWYWGFGYIEEYTSNDPEKAKDIECHSHWDSLIVGKLNKYDIEKGCFVQTECIHHLNDNPDFTATTLNDKESWELADLMKTFYTLREAAGIFNRGGSHVAHTEMNIKDKKLENQINKEILPKIFKRIYEILEPAS